MNFEYFISRKTLKSVVQGKKVSKPIVRISIVSIALAVVVNLITIAVVTGFQQEVRQKITGFGAHALIMGATDESIYESTPIRREQTFLEELRSDPSILSVTATGYKPVLFQSSKNEISYTLANGKDTSEIQQDVIGGIIKGVDLDFNWDFFKHYLTRGSVPNYSPDTVSNHILISEKLATDLNYSVGDTINTFFVRNTPVKRQFIIDGIYSSGLEEFDKKMVIGDLRCVQELNDWGIKTEIVIDDTLTNGHLIVRAATTGGNGKYRFDWGNGFDSYEGFSFCPTKDTLIKVVVSDYWTFLGEDLNSTSVPDTAYLDVKIDGNKGAYCLYSLNEFDEVEKVYSDFSGNNYSINAGQKTIRFSSKPGEGSSSNYVGGYEIMLNDWEQLDDIVAGIEKKVEFIPSPYDELLKVSSIKENQRDIFVWLDFLDINVVIILVLMILIGIINMGSALLVLILIRSNFIGVMKALGANNQSIRKIFLIQSSFLILRGLVWGNALGLAICLAQYYFGIIQLNPDVYYLSEVPISINPLHWLYLNIGTLIVCVTALIIPSMVISRIQPVKSIKFN